MTQIQPLPLSLQIFLLRQQMAQQRQALMLQLTPIDRPAGHFPRSFGMKLLQRQLLSSSPWLLALKNKLVGSEPTLIWSAALLLGQFWLQKINTVPVER